MNNRLRNGYRKYLYKINIGTIFTFFNTACSVKIVAYVIKFPTISLTSFGCIPAGHRTQDHSVPPEICKEDTYLLLPPNV